MEAFEEIMKKHKFNLHSSSYNSSSHGHAFSASGFSFNATSPSYNEWIIDYGIYYHMAKDKTIFFLLMNVTPKTYLSVMIDILVM
jgi:hypothetical protein